MNRLNILVAITVLLVSSSISAVQGAMCTDCSQSLSAGEICRISTYNNYNCKDNMICSYSDSEETCMIPPGNQYPNNGSVVYCQDRGYGNVGYNGVCGQPTLPFGSNCSATSLPCTGTLICQGGNCLSSTNTYPNCTWSYECKSNEACGSDNKCTTIGSKVGEDDPCKATSQCTGDLFCLKKGNSNDTTCQYLYSKSVGDYCSSSYECQNGLWCNDKSICANIQATFKLDCRGTTNYCPDTHFCQCPPSGSPKDGTCVKKPIPTTSCIQARKALYVCLKNNPYTGISLACTNEYIQSDVQCRADMCGAPSSSTTGDKPSTGTSQFNFSSYAIFMIISTLIMIFA